MNDTIEGCYIQGRVTVDGEDIYSPYYRCCAVKSQSGHGFSKPNPFPKSIYENVAYGPKIHGLANNKNHLDEIVEKALTRAGLWAEVKDRLHDSGTGCLADNNSACALRAQLLSNPRSF